MPSRRHAPRDVLPPSIARAVERTEPYWFVIGGQAVRCFCPYRPSDDVDFGVERARDFRELLAQLRKKGRVAEIERTKDTAHLTVDGVDVSVFVLPKIAHHVEDRVLTVTGLLATKLHAILDRGTRRDFFDVYVLLQQERLGILACLQALAAVYETHVDEGLFLRALTYFDDADAEPPLPGEGEEDWATVKAFFAARAAALILPPDQPLSIQSRVVDVAMSGRRAATATTTPKKKKKKKKTSGR